MEERNEQFTIDTPSKANWAIEKIKAAQKRCDIMKQACDDKIAELEAKKIQAEQRLVDETQYLVDMLLQYIPSLPTKKAKTQESIELPAGKLVRKYPAQTLEKTDDLLPYLQSNAPEFVEQTPKVKWKDFKSTLAIVDGHVIRTDTGEMLECVHVVDKPESLEVK